MKFRHSSDESQTAKSAQEGTATETMDEAMIKDEITDEALLEAIVGTGDCPPVSGDAPKAPSSIGYRHRYKHR